MNTIRLLMLTLALLPLAGCLDFGEDIETTSPTPAQIQRCRREMYLAADIKITPLGFKLQGSGIDDLIWLKFTVSASDLAEVFDPQIVDTSKFKTLSAVQDESDPSWWDVEGKNLRGIDQLSLPKVRFMSVAAEKTDTGFVVYITWWEI